MSEALDQYLDQLDKDWRAFEEGEILMAVDTVRVEYALDYNGTLYLGFGTTAVEAYNDGINKILVDELGA